MAIFKFVFQIRCSVEEDINLMNYFRSALYVFLKRKNLNLVRKARIFLRMVKLTRQRLRDKHILHPEFRKRNQANFEKITNESVKVINRNVKSQ